MHLAARGFAAYGFEKQASDISCRFVHLAAREFERTGRLYEKYDAVQQTADVSGKIHFGYPTNEPGFGWTNGVLAEILATM